MGMPLPWSDACTIGAATGSATRDGAPLVFSNSDDPFQTRTRLVVVQSEGGYKFIGTQIISPPPAAAFHRMHTRGLNEAGLAYTWASVAPVTEPTSESAIGIPYEQFGRLLLSSAASVADALDLLDRYPRAYHGNFLFADAAGEIALVEISTRTFHVETRLTDGAFARTNHWISARMVPLGNPGVGQASAERYARASELIAAQAGRIDPRSLMRITADHHGLDASGISICAHGKAPGPRQFRGGTVSSEISEPRAGRFWYCYGWPCGSAPENPESQVFQDRSWGAYLPFDLAALEPGEYVTTDGRLTPRAIAHLATLRAAEPAGARGGFLIGIARHLTGGDMAMDTTHRDPTASRDARLRGRDLLRLGAGAGAGLALPRCWPPAAAPHHPLRRILRQARRRNPPPAVRRPRRPPPVLLPPQRPPAPHRAARRGRPPPRHSSPAPTARRGRAARSGSASRQPNRRRWIRTTTPTRTPATSSA